MTEQIKKNVTEMIVDEEGQLRTKGKNESDHNTMITRMKINDPRRPTYATRWKLDNKEGWKEFNKMVNKDRTKEIIEQASYNEAIKEIKKVPENTEGKRTMRTDKRQKANNPEIKSLRAKRKQAKKEFHEACTSGQEEEKIIKQKTYIEAQKQIREAIEREEAKKIEIRLTKMAEKAKIDPNIIWNARRRAQGSKELEYNTITEAGEIIMNTEETKSHIANYFEDLYQAREGKPEFQEWTDEITTTVQTALQKANNKKQGQEPVTIKETKKAIKNSNERKAKDRMTSQTFLEANQETTKTLTKMINNVHEEESIPRSWLEGNIIRLYKGKGQKGKYSNERGITVASNVGKVYERTINERVKGKEGSATTDHLIALKQIIQEIRNEGKTAYVIFLDVQKAYDKAWLDAILYVLNKNGVDGKNLSMVKKLNSQLTASIQTRYGPTREIKIRDSIRQGGVLSVIENAILIDEISKEIRKRGLGLITKTGNKVDSLLWMDDVCLIHHDQEKLQEILNVTNFVCTKIPQNLGQPSAKW